VRKIYSNFDFNENNALDKDELKHLIDAFLEECRLSNVELEAEELREWFRNIDFEHGKLATKTDLIKEICDLFKIQKPYYNHDDLPKELIMKSALIKRQKTR
jgi:hypothetical protein